MLTPIQNLLEDPEDIPVISPAAATWLESKLNPRYVMLSGHIKRLRADGWTEAAVAGFMLGLDYAADIVNEAIRAHEPGNFDDDE